MTDTASTERPVHSIRRFPAFDTEKVAVALMILLMIQPLYGIFVQTERQSAFSALFYGKATVIRILGWLALGNAAVHFFSDRSLTRKQKFFGTFIQRPWTGFFALVLLWSLISLPTSVNIYRSIFGDGYRYEAILSYFAYAGIYASASLISREQYRKIILKTGLLASAVVAIATMIAEATNSSFILVRGGYTALFSGTFLNPNHYAYYLCVILVVCAAVFTNEKDIRQKVLYGVVFTLNLIVLILNSTLGSYLAFLAGMILLVIFNGIRKGWKATWTVALLLVLVLIATLVIPSTLVKDIRTTCEEVYHLFEVLIRVAKDEAPVEDLDTINGGTNRLQIWIATLKCIGDKPLFGCGADNIYYTITDHMKEGHIPHNEYLQVTANLGIPAGIFYVTAILWLAIRSFARIKKLPEYVFYAGLGAATYAFSAAVGVSMTICAFLFFLMLGLLNSERREPSQPIIESKTSEPQTKE